MPLHPNAVSLIRANLEEISRDWKVRSVVIGVLTEAQLRSINDARSSRPNPFPPIVAEVLFFGSHVYASRVVRDGYTI